MVKIPSGLITRYYGLVFLCSDNECNHGVVSVTHDLKGSLMSMAAKGNSAAERDTLKKTGASLFQNRGSGFNVTTSIPGRPPVMISVAKYRGKEDFSLALLPSFPLTAKQIFWQTYNGARGWFTQEA